MAVYPNKIVLKDTTDATTTAVTAISNGTEDIVFGELVVNRISGEAFLLTKVSAGTGVVVSAPSPLGNRGDITVSASGYTWTINNGAVTNAKITGPISIANGGSGQATANAALNAFLPTQTNNTGKSLLTDGTNTYWAATVPLTGVLNDVVKWNGSSWTSASFSTFSINELGDVDTATKPPVKNQSLTWDGTTWVPGVSSTRIGRGDGGDFDTTQVESAFVFAVWGGGDFDLPHGNNHGDIPIELLVASTVDGGEIISDYTAISVPSSLTKTLTAGTPVIGIGKSIIVPAVTLTLEPQEIIRVGYKGYVIVESAVETTLATPSNPLIQAGSEDQYFSDFGIQTYRWDNDIMVDWWAE